MNKVISREYVEKNYIHKNKIKEKIEELEKECKQYEEMTPSARRYDGIQKIDIQINILNDLLEV